MNRSWHTNDPPTSVAAALLVGKFAKEHYARIISALESADRPLAAEEIAAISGFENHVPVNRRLSELERGGMVCRTDELHTK